MSLTWDGMINGISFLGIENAPELSATAGGIREKEDGACAECIPSSPGYFASPAPASEDALAGTGGGEHTKESSPLKKFAGEIDAQTGQVSASATSPAIHSGDTIERLCEERGRR